MTQRVDWYVLGVDASLSRVAATLAGFAEHVFSKEMHSSSEKDSLEGTYLMMGQGVEKIGSMAIFTRSRFAALFLFELPSRNDEKKNGRINSVRGQTRTSVSPQVECDHSPDIASERDRSRFYLDKLKVRSLLDVGGIEFDWSTGGRSHRAVALESPECWEDEGRILFWARLVLSLLATTIKPIDHSEHTFKTLLHLLRSTGVDGLALHTSSPLTSIASDKSFAWYLGLLMNKLDATRHTIRASNSLWRGITRWSAGSIQVRAGDKWIVTLAPGIGRESSGANGRTAFVPWILAKVLARTTDSWSQVIVVDVTSLDTRWRARLVRYFTWGYRRIPAKQEK